MHIYVRFWQANFLCPYFSIRHVLMKFYRIIALNMHGLRFGRFFIVSDGRKEERSKEKCDVAGNSWSQVK